MLDDIHTGIRTLDDIKTYKEVYNDIDNWVIWEDFTESDIKKAYESGKVKVYSSYPIKDANFVTPSYEQAYEYAGGGKV